MIAHEVYQRVKEEIENSRNKAIADAEYRRQRVHEESGTVAYIDSELSKTGLALFRAACKGEDIAPIKNRNAELIAKRAEALASLGYPADYTEPKFNCPLCSDTGSVDMKVCTCFKKRLVTENIKNSGIGRLIEVQSFDNFDIERYKSTPEVYERMSANVKIAKRYAKKIGKDSGNLLIMGKTGVGKTHISTAIAKAVIELGYSVLYDSAQNIVSDYEADKFKSGYDKSEPRAEKYTECDLLIIDDLGTEFVNQFTISCLYNLINTRQNKGLPTVISTNLSASELVSRYEGRISSRLLGKDTTMLMFDSQDYRIYQ